MSDSSQGPGWWQASDGKWYPPESHPNYSAPPPPGPTLPPAPTLPPTTPAQSYTQVLEQASPPIGNVKRQKRKKPVWKRWWFIVILLLVAFVVFAVAVAPDEDEDEGSGNDAPGGTVPSGAPDVTLPADQIPLVGRADATHESSQIRAADYGEDWPLAVDHGLVVCESWPAPFERLAVFFVDPDGTVYAVNGTALGTAEEHGWAEIEAIWLPNPAIEGSKIAITPVIQAGLDICDAVPVDPNAVADAALTPDSVREFAFPITFESSRETILEVLNELTIVQSVDGYVYDTATGVVHLDITPAFDFDSGVRDDAWAIMRAMSEAWGDPWYEPSTQWSPGLNVSISTAEYQCTGEQMRLMVDARFNRDEWEATCRVR